MYEKTLFVYLLRIETRLHVVPDSYTCRIKMNVIEQKAQRVRERARDNANEEPTKKQIITHSPQTPIYLCIKIYIDFCMLL